MEQKKLITWYDLNPWPPISTQEVIETNCGNKNYEFKSVISSSVTWYFLFAPCKVISDREVWEILHLESRIRKFCWCNLESWPLESGIRPNECGIPLAIGIRNPESKFHWQRIKNPVTGNRIQDFKIFLVSLQRAIFFVLTPVTHRICRFKKHLTVTSENVCWSIRT